MSYQLYDLVGTFGVLMIVGCYFLLQVGRMSSAGLPYSFWNGLGAMCILYSLYFEFNLPAFIIELFWLLISLLGVWRIYRNRPRKVL